ncbi:MAG: hypothetical protein IPJ03_22170 [Ignavibacteriales bacterium]|nr:hypothetical protein [Ignavibacteriales bacterium]MBK7381648.1 hypothetical protein [Ignavibacteriales bacterium]
MIIELIQVDRTSEFVVFIDKKPMQILELQTSHISLGIGNCNIKLVVIPKEQGNNGTGQG